MLISGLRAGLGRWRAAVLSVVGSVFCATAASAVAPDALVIGDSLGVGVSMASGLSRLARNSVAIRGGSVLGQLKQAPSGAVVFMSLGTNDAVGRIEGLDGDIGRIVSAAAAAGVKLVWIGPPCVKKSWDTNAQKLDGILKARTAGTGVVYVSMRDDELCGGGNRAKDGVHFTMAGYGQMWARAKLAAGFTGGKTMLAAAAPEKRAKKRRIARKKTRYVAATGAAPKRSERLPREAARLGPTPPPRPTASAER